jgi:hypothetical protein
MNINNEIYTNRSLLEILSAKIGGFSIYLGVMLFLNLYMFFRGRKISSAKRKASELLTNH